MSNKLSMVALDKIEVKFSMKVETIVRIERMMKIMGVSSRSAVINALIDDDVKDVQLEASDIDKITNMMKANLARRNMLKARKGLM